jgi:hypothetical protein
MMSSLAAGGAAGVYQSAWEDTALDEVDPQELALRAQAMAEEGRELKNVNSAVVGTLLGASQYLGQTMAPDEYAE